MSGNGGNKVTPVTSNGEANGFTYTGEAKGGNIVTLVDDQGQDIVLSGSVTTNELTYDSETKELTSNVNGVSSSASLAELGALFYREVDASPNLTINENWQTIATLDPANEGTVMVDSGRLMGEMTFSRVGGGGTPAYVNVRFVNNGIPSGVKSQLIDRDELQVLFFQNLRRINALNSNVDIELQVKYTSTPDGNTAGGGTGTLERVVASVEGKLL